MTRKTMPADDLAVGDVITSVPEPVTVREVTRAPNGAVVVNPGAVDEAKGWPWEAVTVER